MITIKYSRAVTVVSDWGKRVSVFVFVRDLVCSVHCVRGVCDENADVQDLSAVPNVQALK